MSHLHALVVFLYKKIKKYSHTCVPGVHVHMYVRHVHVPVLLALNVSGIYLI